MNMSVRNKSKFEIIVDWIETLPNLIGIPLLLLIYPFAWIYNQFKEDSND